MKSSCWFRCEGINLVGYHGLACVVAVGSLKESYCHIKMMPFRRKKVLLTISKWSGGYISEHSADVDKLLLSRTLNRFIGATRSNFLGVAPINRIQGPIVEHSVR